MIQEPEAPVASSLMQAGSGPYSSLVLAECGDEMWLASVRFEQPPRPGMTFHFQGTVWQLTWTDQAGCTATPLPM